MHLTLREREKILSLIFPRWDLDPTKLQLMQIADCWQAQAEAGYFMTGVLDLFFTLVYKFFPNRIFESSLHLPLLGRGYCDWIFSIAVLESSE